MDKLQALMTDQRQVNLNLIKDMCKSQKLNDSELKAYLWVCERSGLDPVRRQIYIVKRWDKSLGREVPTYQTSIDGFRLIAERSGNYAGQVGPWWCGDDGVWKDVWLGKSSPMASKVGVLRKDFNEPLFAVATLETYMQKDRNGNPSGFWKNGSDVMLAKCAESLAIRRAFPENTSGLYTKEELSFSNEGEEKEVPENIVKECSIVPIDKNFNKDTSAKQNQKNIVPVEIPSGYPIWVSTYKSIPYIFARVGEVFSFAALEKLGLKPTKKDPESIYVGAYSDETTIKLMELWESDREEVERA